MSTSWTVEGDASRDLDSWIAARRLLQRRRMLAAGVLLLLIGALGAFDVFVFHHRQARLVERPAARREAWLHVARGVVYTLQFALTPNVRWCGAWYAVFVALYVADAAIAVADVLAEPASRRGVGGLPRG